MGKVVIVATVLGAAAICAAGGLIVNRRIKNGVKWSRTMEILRDFKEKCGTSIENLKEVADAMVAEMNAGLVADNVSRVKMLISYVDNLPTGYFSTFFHFGFKLFHLYPSFWLIIENFLMLLLLLLL